MTPSPARPPGAPDNGHAPSAACPCRKVHWSPLAQSMGGQSPPRPVTHIKQLRPTWDVLRVTATLGSPSSPTLFREGFFMASLFGKVFLFVGGSNGVVRFRVEITRNLTTGHLCFQPADPYAPPSPFITTWSHNSSNQGLAAAQRHFNPLRRALRHSDGFMGSGSRQSPRRDFCASVWRRAYSSRSAGVCSDSNCL